MEKTAFDCENGLTDLNRDLLMRLIMNLRYKVKIKTIFGMSLEHYRWAKSLFFKKMRYRYMRNFSMNEHLTRWIFNYPLVWLGYDDGSREIEVNLEKKSIRKKDENRWFIEVLLENFNSNEARLFSMVEGREIQWKTYRGGKFTPFADMGEAVYMGIIAPANDRAAVFAVAFAAGHAARVNIKLWPLHRPQYPPLIFFLLETSVCLRRVRSEIGKVFDLPIFQFQNTSLFPMDSELPIVLDTDPALRGVEVLLRFNYDGVIHCYGN